MFTFFKNIFKSAASNSQNAIYGFSDAFENSPIGMSFVSFEGDWLKVNTAFAKIVGYTENELLKMKFQDITHPEDLPRDLKKIKEMLDGKTQFYQVHKRYIAKNGTVIPTLLSVSFVKNADGSPKHLYSQIVDMSEFENLQEKVKELSKIHGSMAEQKIATQKIKADIDKIIS